MLLLLLKVLYDSVTDGDKSDDGKWTETRLERVVASNPPCGTARSPSVVSDHTIEPDHLVFESHRSN